MRDWTENTKGVKVMTPYDVGYEARERGEPREAQKIYPNDAERRAEWEQGWDDADESIRVS